MADVPRCTTMADTPCEGPVHRYLNGDRCDAHSPWALKGTPRPGFGASCAPNRHYCGGACPTFNDVAEHTYG